MLEKGVITDHVFDSIHRMLPAESSLSSAATPTPALMHDPSPSPAPPAYNATGPPTLPTRRSHQPPPPPPPTKPVIARARALYKYQAADDRDLSLEKDDPVVVHEYMNDDWWMGRNTRTGAEGIFPKNYVQVDNEKTGFYAPTQPVYAASPSSGSAHGAYPPPPQTHNPYNSHAPPMAVATGDDGGSAGKGKVNEHGKKFGKKLGNAAIFGAGATIGSNIVNSIF